MDTLDNRHRAGRWLRALIAEAEPGAVPDRLALRHVQVNDRQVDVATVALPKEAGDAAALDGVLDKVHDAIENDVGGLGGNQKYVLVALKEGRQISRLPVRVTAPDADGGEGDALETEPATPKGLLGQLMRHNEVQSRLFAMSMGQVIGTMQRTIVRLQENAEEADARRLAAVEAAEEYITQDHERKAATQMVEDNRIAKARVLTILGGAMPLVMQFLRQGLGMKAGAADTPVGALVAKLMQSLRPEQIEKLTEILSPEQMEVVGQIFEAQEAAAGEPGAPPDATEAAEEPGGAKEE
jgi:hypothetical protein